MKALITGSAGFIGFHLAKFLLSQGVAVVGVDSLNSYYDKSLKKLRLEILRNDKNFYFFHNDINELTSLKIKDVDIIINLAAQAGVRASDKDHEKYISSNINGFHKLLEFFKNQSCNKLIHASSSSVYGNDNETPFNETMNPYPSSVYASTKVYSENLAKICTLETNKKIVCLRFFSVYGEYGRPDMAYYLFSSKISNNEKIILLNEGNMYRDYTYIHDIISGLSKVIDYSFKENFTYEVFNLGNEKPIKTLDLIDYLEKKLEKKAIIEHRNSNLESKITFADLGKSKNLLGYKPEYEFYGGMDKFIDWFLREGRNYGKK